MKRYQSLRLDRCRERCDRRETEVFISSARLWSLRGKKRKNRGPKTGAPVRQDRSIMGWRIGQPQ